jgi:hypothetical protein
MIIASVTLVTQKISARIDKNHSAGAVKKKNLFTDRPPVGLRQGRMPLGEVRNSVTKPPSPRK